MPTDNTFICDHCHQVYTKGWTEAEAREEAVVRFPGHDIEGMAMLCDDCYGRFLAWLDRGPDPAADLLG